MSRRKPLPEKWPRHATVSEFRSAGAEGMAIVPKAHVCSPSAAVSMSLSLGMRSSVRETCTCGRTTAWISNHLGKVVALPARGES